MLNNWLPLIILLVAFITAMLMFLIQEKNEKLRTLVNLSSAAVNIVLIFIMVAGVYQGQVFETRLPLLPDINLVLNADALSLMFVSLSGVLWFFTTLYAVGYFRKGKHRSRFFGFFSLCVFSTLGVALAGNLITFLIFYELLTLATYPLIVHKGNEASLHSGKVYLRYTMIGGALLMVGVVWLKSIAGPLDFATRGLLATIPDLGSVTLIIIFALLIIGLGVKAALFPLHGWLPRAMAAPAPVSSLLHAVAVVKAGAFGITRVVYDVYGVELAGSLGLLQVLIVLACFTIIYGSIRAVFQNDIKKRLAYSTVSQVSYITLGIALASPIAAVGAIAHLVHQGLMKITMFFCAGNLAESLHIYKVSELNGVAKKMPVTMSAFTIAVLGMIGIPPVVGFVSKWYLGVGAIEAGYPWVIAVLAGSSILNAIYFLPLVYRAWFLPPVQTALETAEHPTHPTRNTHAVDSNIEHNNALANVKTEAHWMMLLPPVVTISLAVLAGVFAQSGISPLSWSKLIVESKLSDSVLAGLNTTAPLTSTTGSSLPAIAILLPLLMAAMIWLIPYRKTISLLLPLCALPAIYLGAQPETFSEAYTPLFFGSQLILDEMTRGYLLLAGVLWFLGSLYSCFYYGLGENQRQFYSLFALAMASSFGLVLSSDLFGFITFFTAMSLASYVLIIRGGQTPARKAANTYIKWVIVGEVALFSGFCLAQFISVSPGFNDPSLMQLMAAMLLVGFGIKIGLFGLHAWLPLAHPVAVVPASALLSGFMVKAGMIGWLKFFPLGLGSVSFYTPGLIVTVIAITGTFYAAVVGVIQKDPKAVLAYSTVSQMGILSSCFGVLLMYPELRTVMVPVIVFYSIHHGLAKSALFLSVGAGDLFNRHVGSNGFIVMVFYLVLAIPAISLVGAPLMSGYFAKTELKELLVQLPYLKTAVALSSLFTGLLMCRFIHRLKVKAQKSAIGITSSQMHGQQTYIPLLLICALNTILVLISPLYLAQLMEQQPSLLQSIGMADLVMATLPLLLSVLIYALGHQYGSRMLQNILSATTPLFNLLRPLQKAVYLFVIPPQSFGREDVLHQSDAASPKNNWLTAKEHVTKNMNSPSVAVLMMVIGLLLVASLQNG